jgi:hypothetical protein
MQGVCVVGRSQYKDGRKDIKCHLARDKEERAGISGLGGGGKNGVLRVLRLCQANRFTMSFIGVLHRVPQRPNR